MSDKRFGDWLDERIGHRERLARWLDSPLVGGARWAYVLGSLLGFCFVLLAATGIILMTAYAPSPQTAWASVHMIDETSGGRLVRGLHHYASHAMILLVFAHLGHIIVSAGYKRPREIYFWLTLALVGLVMGLAITGHLLPWDQKGYWARQVEANIAGMAPGGAFVQQMIQGGPELGAMSLTRAYAVHVALLPALFLLILVGRAFAAPKVVALAGADATRNAPYFRQLSRNIVGAVALTAALVAIVLRAHGAPLDAPADPLSDYPARPEWFLLPMYQLRKYFHGAGEFYGTVGLPALAGLYLFVLPLVDRSKSHHARDRLGVLAPFFALGIGAVMLGWLAVRHDASDADYKKARLEADRRAAVAQTIHEVPPAGALYAPELRGYMLFEKSCAGCHVLGDLGDPTKATAPSLDKWGTEEWLRKMIHEPDNDLFFGKTPYKGEMPSVDVPEPPAKPGDKPVPPMLKTKEQVDAVALYLATQGDEPGERKTPANEAARATGEKIVKEQCTGCHLMNGEGDDNTQGEAPELSGYGSIAWTTQQITNPATDKTYRTHAGDPKVKGLMPAFEEELSAADIDILARWLRAQTRGVPLTMTRAVSASRAPVATATAKSSPAVDVAPPPPAPAATDAGAARPKAADAGIAPAPNRAHD